MPKTPRNFIAVFFFIYAALMGSSTAKAQATAVYLGTDTTTLGNWTGHYGADGQIIPNDLNSPPAYAAVTMTGSAPYTWASPDSDPRSLQVSSGSATRIASMFHGFIWTIDVNLTDGNAHNVALYLCDWDSGNRAEIISVVDANSQAVLSSQNFPSFVSGEYATWEIKGHAQIQIVGTAGFNAIVNGIFFDTPGATAAPTVTLTASPAQIQSGSASTLNWSSTNASTCTASGGWSGAEPTSGSTSESPATTSTYTLTCTGAGGSAQATATVTVAANTTPASAVYVGTDTTTLGNWTGHYGADGQIIPNDLNSPPAYAEVNLTGSAPYTWASPDSDPRSLQVASGSATRIASMFHGFIWTIDVNVTDGNAHNVALYLCDWDSGNRAEIISVVDANSQAVLSTQNYASFVGGEYATWTVKGHVQIQIVGTAGFNAIVNGIFFDTPGSSTAPTVTLTANPTQIQPGTGSTLTWSSTNATTCTASGGWSGTEPTSGSISVSPSATTAYNLSCTGAGGTAQASATVTVTAAGAPSTWIYYNGLYTWPADWSFGATINYSSTAGSPLSGAYDIQVSAQQWGAWQPYAGSSLDLTPYKYVTFSLEPTVANQAWSFVFTKANGGGAGTTVNVLNYGPAPVVGKWGVYTIPLTDLGVSGAAITTMAIQDQTGLTSNTWYIDNVALSPTNVIDFPPTAALSASPALLTGSGTTTLTWSSNNATACTATGGWTGSLATSGTKSVAVSASSGYGITCSGPGGSANASTAVTVTNPGVFSIQVSGNTFVNGAGQTVQLRGVNLSGMEGVAVQGWDPSDPTGGAFGQPNNPKWSAINAWKAGIVRIPLNEDSWLGLTCTDTDGVVHNADPGANYKQFLANLVQEANAAGLYVILDLHWAAPGNSCPMLQSQMADSDHSIAFWTSIANTYKNNPAVMFELFNEPFLDFDFTGDPWQYMMFGTGGSFSGYPATSNNGNWQNVTAAWNIASYQDMINAIRGTGAMNVVLIGSVSYTADLSGWLAHKPNDPTGQMAATWHPYPTFGATWGTPAWAQPNYSPEIFTEVQGILAAGIPVIATETGDQDTAGTVGAPLVQTITTFADANGVSVLGWTWDVWTNPDFVLIKDVNGTPTDGYGQFFQAWMVNHK